MFVKYNGVLRGLGSLDSDFLVNSMVQLCCAKAVADAYMGGARVFEAPRGKLPFEEAKRSLNR